MVARQGLSVRLQGARRSRCGVIVDDEQRRRRAETPCRPSGCGRHGAICGVLARLCRAGLRSRATASPLEATPRRCPASPASWRLASGPMAPATRPSRLLPRAARSLAKRSGRAGVTPGGRRRAAKAGGDRFPSVDGAFLDGLLGCQREARIDVAAVGSARSRTCRSSCVVLETVPRRVVFIALFAGGPDLLVRQTGARHRRDLLDRAAAERRSAGAGNRRCRDRGGALLGRWIGGGV